jgi:hypothetical protein
MIDKILTSTIDRFGIGKTLALSFFAGVFLSPLILKTLKVALPIFSDCTRIFNSGKNHTLGIPCFRSRTEAKVDEVYEKKKEIEPVDPSDS